MESQTNWMKYCQDHIIKRMKSDRYGSLFSNPVLEASDSIIPPSVKENYRMVIKTPMDYKTVKLKLERGSYNKPEDFYNDMKLIFDNCMKFNPPFGNSKWAHDAAVSNLKKFNRMWENSSKTVNKLYEKSQKPSLDKKSPDETSQAPSSIYNDFQVTMIGSNYLNASDLNSALMNETSEVPLSPDDSLNLFPEPVVDSSMDLHCSFNSNDITPRNKWSFRLNLQSIQEYKVRNGFLNQTPEINNFSSYLDPKPLAEPELSVENTTSPVNYEAYQSDIMSTVHTTVDVPNFESYNDSNLNTVDGTMEYEDLETEPTSAFPVDVPQILSKNDDGVVCVSFFSQNECNRLFPNCNIIGLNTQKPNYNISDVSIRYIYNQLYMNDINNVKFDQKKDMEQEDQYIEEQYKLKENRSKVKINFNSVSDANFNYYSPNCLNYYRTNNINLAPRDTDNTELVVGGKRLDKNIFYNSDTEEDEVVDMDKAKTTFKRFINRFMNGDRESNAGSPGTNINGGGGAVHGNTNGTSEIKYSNGYANVKEFNGSDTPDHVSTDSGYHLGEFEDEVRSVKDEVVELFIDIDSNSILNVSEAEGLLERNLFSRVSVKGEYFKIYEKPQLSLLCGNKGYFKLDESDFVFEDADMKHIRIFFFNCSKSKVRVSCKRSTFTELVLQNRYNFSLVSNLHNEFKLGNVSNLPFFTLPNSTPICFSKQQDILYRFQLIHNSLPVKLLALHIISTQ